MAEYSDNFLDLYPNRSMLLDPEAVGRYIWPNKITLPADLNFSITSKMWTYIAENNGDISDCISCLLYISGAISYNASFYSLAKAKKFSNSNGFYFNLSSDRDLFARKSPYKNRSRRLREKLKDTLSMLYNKCHFFYHYVKNDCLTVTITNDKIVHSMLDNPYLIRNPSSMIHWPFFSNLGDSDQLIDECTGIVFSFVQDTIEQHDVNVDERFGDLLHDYIHQEVVQVFRDLARIRSFFGKRKFHLVERSLSPYLISLVATVCRRNGGEVHSTYHGVCQTANEPDISTMINSSVFWGASEAFCEDAKELVERLPPEISREKIRNLNLEGLDKKYLQGKKLRERIEHVAIMGRQVVMRYSAFNTLEFAVYLKLEKELAQWLLERGYTVTYKAHPESDWRHFGSYFPDEVHVDWAPFEDVAEKYDAVFYHFGASSTLPRALASSAHIFMLKDGWHDVRLWPTRVQNCFEMYCNMVPATLSDTDFVSLDFSAFERALLAPRRFLISDRIRDFYYRKVFS